MKKIVSTPYIVILGIFLALLLAGAMFTEAPGEAPVTVFKCSLIPLPANK